MITKFNEYIKEGVRDLMTPRTEEDILRAYASLVKSLKNCSVDNYPDEFQEEFKKISDILGVPKDSLCIVSQEGDQGDYEKLEDIFDDIIDSDNKVKFDGINNEYGEPSGEWTCYPKQKIGSWSSSNFDDPKVWIFPNNLFSDKLYESIRNMMTPKSKEEILNSLKGDRTIVFKPTNNPNYDMEGEIGNIDVSYSDLVVLFGEPNGEVDGYKVSTEWDLVDNLGRYVGIKDWKQTNLFYPDYPSVEEFRRQSTYNWIVIGNYYSKDKETLLEDLRTYIISHII